MSAAWSAATKPTAVEPGADAGLPRCRHCGTPLSETFVDLGMSPLCERFLRADQLDEMEPFFPLHVRVCRGVPPRPAARVRRARGDLRRVRLLLVVLRPRGWPMPRRYVDMAIDRLRPRARQSRHRSRQQRRLSPASMRGSGGSPSWASSRRANIADVAREKGIPTISEFLGAELGRRVAAEQGAADLVVANNVFAHVPDIHDFAAGLAALLAPEGVLTIEFPHLVRLVEGNQFDTIYHEHFTYFTLHTASAVLATSRPRGLRCRRAADPRRLAADLRAARGDRASGPRGGRRPRAGDRGGGRLDDARGSPELRTAGRGDEAGAPAFLIAERDAGQSGRRLRRARQGQHPAELLRHPVRPAGVRRRSQPVQARPVHARDAHPDPSGRSACWTTGPTSCSSCPGTCGPRSARSSGRSSIVACGSSVPIPEVEILG